MTSINWNEYIEIVILGIKQYLIKDRLENLEKAKWQVTRYLLVLYSNLFSCLTILKTFDVCTSNFEPQY